MATHPLSLTTSSLYSAETRFLRSLYYPWENCASLPPFGTQEVVFLEYPNFPMRAGSWKLVPRTRSPDHLFSFPRTFHFFSRYLRSLLSIVSVDGIFPIGFQTYQRAGEVISTPLHYSLPGCVLLPFRYHPTTPHLNTSSPHPCYASIRFFFEMA